MRVTVLGCSGSVTGPDSPASGYLISAENSPPLVLDFGGGVLGALQRYLDPGDATLLLSHLHADHCLDIPGLLVWRRYHPNPPEGKALAYGPTDTAMRIGAASSEVGGHIDDISDVLDVHVWKDGHAVTFGDVTVLPRRVFHPPESYGFRFTDGDGAVFASSGDTGMCDAVFDLAKDADVFLCEASWTHSPDRPVGVHLSGTEAGQIAREAGVGQLLLTHIPPWTSREAIFKEAQAEFDGPVHVVQPDDQFQVVQVAPADLG
ncbi:cyclic nucleotide-degrading phosphodiesterase [Hoyosella altamirensis]|uniref:Ribonuclease BN (tRNA processing enzyme) n=1 Tax=Hoyosella altamirensis TaxID=616997 RepID=A0A839RHB8_9ACTN|nr:cyclic nucleotide-degrading phosphodiesterase [Hoyosella altamirensis]MBB3035810.1 ribonuclease BN (tRNA processing enzyme) [Hoyosella altamirensis]